MKYRIAIIAAILFLSSCKKTEVPQPQTIDSTNDQALAIKKAIEHQDKNSLKTHKGTLEALMNLPGGGPIPPLLLPVKDLQLTSETDSTASYSFIGGSSGAKAKIELKRKINGSDTSWIASPAEEIR